MKCVSLCILFSMISAWAQTAPTASPSTPPDPDAVVATYWDGKKMTYGEMQQFLHALPPQMQQMALRNRKNFVLQLGLMRKLAELGAQNKLDQQSPTKEALEFNRMYLLMTAELTDYMNKISIEPDELQKEYEARRSNYQQVKVKVIYIPFTANPASGSKALTEEQAREKIGKILGEARGGADFVKLVKQYSEDQTSAAKDGDFGTIRHSDKIPDAILKTVFQLKQGEISEPVRQPNGYYLFRAEEIRVRPFQEVRNELTEEVRQERYKQWLDQNNNTVVSKYENEQLLAAPAPSPAPPAKK